MKFRQIKFDEWIKGDYRPFAEIKVKASEFEIKFDITFENSFEDGLGETKSAAFLTENGTQFFLQEYLPNSKNSLMQVFLLNDKKTLSNDLDEVLEVLGLTLKNLTWFDESIKLQPYELWRQDDNGHKFLIETFSCRADAVKAMKEFEARLHKQTYWVEKA